MSTSRSMTTLSRVLEKINERGYTDEIIIDEEGAKFDGKSKNYKADELTIQKVYRFEGESDPADMSVLYIVEAGDGSKGFLVNAYGIYSDQDNPFYDDFIVDVPVNEMEGFDLEK